MVTGIVGKVRARNGGCGDRGLQDAQHEDEARGRRVERAARAALRGECWGGGDSGDWGGDQGGVRAKNPELPAEPDRSGG